VATRRACAERPPPRERAVARAARSRAAAASIGRTVAQCRRGRLTRRAGAAGGGVGGSFCSGTPRAPLRFCTWRCCVGDCASTAVGVGRVFALHGAAACDPHWRDGRICDPDSTWGGYSSPRYICRVCKLSCCPLLRRLATPCPWILTLARVWQRPPPPPPPPLSSASGSHPQTPRRRPRRSDEGSAHGTAAKRSAAGHRIGCTRCV